MKNNKRLLFALFLLPSLVVFGQSPIITPQSGNETICPSERKIYTVNDGTNYDNCSSYAWTVSNGSFSFGSTTVTSITTTYEVDVSWNNTISDGILSLICCSIEDDQAVAYSYPIGHQKFNKL